MQKVRKKSIALTYGIQLQKTLNKSETQRTFNNSQNTKINPCIYRQ